MPQWEPWVVRHLYSVVEPDLQYPDYLGAMKDKLGRAQEAEWISTVHDRPIRTRDDIAGAFKASETGEMIIVDLHGFADGDGTWLGPHADEPFLNLRELGDATLGAAAIVLTNCEGAKDVFIDEVRRLTGHPVALVGHFDIARMWDTTPVDVVNAMLYWADGGHEEDAYRAAHELLVDKLQFSNQWWLAKWIRT
ncbi:hypothetical protein [Streptomyces violascens]|uniref:hypothetical protein n=1 Tax=Streptomyces violascens TaxID=67381 RepID=UPI0036BC2580